MRDRELEAADHGRLMAGIRISIASIAWTLITSTISIVLGVAENSLVLIAFGMTNLVDTFGSIALVAHFRHALHHEAFSGRSEQITFNIVTFGLITIASATAIESVRRLVMQSHAASVIFGVFVAGASAAVLSALAFGKVKVGRELQSRALVADGWLSTTGALLGVVTVLGAFLANAGWWWADPIAAAVVAVGALSAATRMHARNE